MVVLLNRGPRTWDLHDGMEKDGKVVRLVRTKEGAIPEGTKVIKRKLMPTGAPGQSIEALDQAEADQVLAHRDVVDAEKVAPVVGDKIAALTKQVADLEWTIGELKERLSKYETAEQEDQENSEKKKGGGKK
jgi:hypothetical protein